MATASVGLYRPRHPERTVLHRALAQNFERYVLASQTRGWERFVTAVGKVISEA